MDFDILKKGNQRRIHIIKNHSIWIKICEEIKQQKLGGISERKLIKERNQKAKVNQREKIR